MPKAAPGLRYSCRVINPPSRVTDRCGVKSATASALDAASTAHTAKAIKKAATVYRRDPITRAPQPHATGGAAANTAAKAVVSNGRRMTALECRPSRKPFLDDYGRSAHAYGSEGWGFESLRAHLRGWTPPSAPRSKANGDLVAAVTAAKGAILMP